MAVEEGVRVAEELVPERPREGHAQLHGRLPLPLRVPVVELTSPPGQLLAQLQEEGGEAGDDGEAEDDLVDAGPERLLEGGQGGGDVAREVGGEEGAEGPRPALVRQVGRGVGGVAFEEGFLRPSRETNVPIWA